MGGAAPPPSTVHGSDVDVSTRQPPKRGCGVGGGWSWVVSCCVLRTKCVMCMYKVRKQLVGFDVKICIRIKVNGVKCDDVNMTMCSLVLNCRLFLVLSFWYRCVRFIACFWISYFYFDRYN